MELEQRSTNEYVDPGSIAMIYAWTGDTAEALIWLETALRARSTMVIHITDHWYPALVDLPEPLLDLRQPQNPSSLRLEKPLSPS